MSRIFISYRREDSAPYAGRLYDRLSQRFGEDQVFIDIDTIRPGVDFVEVVEEAVGSCDALVAVIGKHWLTVTGRDGRRRLDNPEDFVRLEVATALKRDILTIPVLVEGAAMPPSDELPEDLARLARRNALEVSDARWAFDVGRLIHTLEEVLDEPGPTDPQSPPVGTGTPVTQKLEREEKEPHLARQYAGGEQVPRAQEEQTVAAPYEAPKTVPFDTPGEPAPGRKSLLWTGAVLALLVLVLLIALPRLGAMVSGGPEPTPPAISAVANVATDPTASTGLDVAPAASVQVSPTQAAATPAPVAAVAAPPGAFRIAIGDTVDDGVPGPGAGYIDTPGAKDVYTFTAAAGQTVYFQVKEGTNGSIPWKVIDENETVVFETCLCGDTGAFKLTHGGTYIITVGSDTNGQTGAYRFKLWDVPPPDRFEIAIGDAAEDGVPGPGAGYIETPGAKDIYTFTATPGQSVYFQVKQGEGTNSSIPWKAIDENETVVFETCLCGDTGTFKLRRGGTYIITVGSDTNGQIGTYQFKLWNVPPPERFEIAIGDTIEEGVPGPGAGNIETPGAKDIYTFTAAAGQSVYFQVMEGTNGSIRWQATDENDTVVFDTCLCGDAGTFKLQRGGTYTITVGSDTSAVPGTYQFRISAP